jgi:MtN3 and saliva related transmembrane protein
MTIFDVIFDDSVSTTMNVFLVIGNVINFIYNIPQVIKTYKTKSTRDFSSTFLFMRVIGNCIWLSYAIELKAFLFILSNIVSVISSIIISYYKVLELQKARLASLDVQLYTKMESDQIEEEM